MANSAGQQQPKLDRYVVIHVATTCDEHGVYVTKDSAEVIELGWILLDAKSCEEVLRVTPSPLLRKQPRTADGGNNFLSCTVKASWSSRSILR